MPMIPKNVLKVFTVIVGCFFLLSGFGKALDTAAFSNLIASYGFSFMMIFAPLLPVIEIALGTSLIFLINPKRDSLIALFFLICFTSAFTFAHFHNGVNDCGCFGSFRPSSWGANISFIQNFILMGLCILVRGMYPKDEVKVPVILWKKGAIGVLVFAGMFISFMTFSMPSSLHNLTHTSKFQNQNILHTELGRLLTPAPDKTYLVFCFSYTCTHCWNSFENVRGFRKTGTVDSIVAFAVGDSASQAFFNQYFQPDFPIRTLQVEEFDKITTSYPVGFFIKNDTIKFVIDGEIPSSLTFRKTNNIAFNPPKSKVVESCTPTSCGH